MGRLMYDSTAFIEFDDRTLAHLQIVIGAKLRRGECFLFSWTSHDTADNPRNSIWLAPGISLHFKYYGSRPPAINSAWIEDLSAMSNQDSGLRLVPEPSESREDVHSQSTDD